MRPVHEKNKKSMAVLCAATHIHACSPLRVHMGTVRRTYYKV